MGRILSIAVAYIAQTLKVKMAYRTEFLVTLFSTFLWNGVNLAFFQVIFQHVPDLRGWSHPQVVFLYGFGQVVFGLYSMAVFGLMWDFSSTYLVEGNLDRMLVRPYPVLLQMVLETVAIFDILVVAQGGVIVALAMGEMGISLGPLDLLAFAILAASGAAVLAGIALVLTFISFWWPNRYGLFRPLFTLTEYSRYPLRIFPRWVQVLMTVVLPFGFTCFYPASWFFTDPGLRRMAWVTPFVGLLLLTLAVWILHRGIRRYESSGS